MALLENQLSTVQTGDSRTAELERRIATLQAAVAAKDRTLRSQYRQILCCVVFIVPHSVFHFVYSFSRMYSMYDALHQFSKK